MSKEQEGIFYGGNMLYTWGMVTQILLFTKFIRLYMQNLCSFLNINVIAIKKKVHKENKINKKIYKLYWFLSLFTKKLVLPR